MKIRSDFHVLANPYDEQESIAVVPALRPDVALFHGYKADTLGNVVAHPSQNNRLLAQASRVTVVSVEEIVSPEELRQEKGAFIPSLFVTGVVHTPIGAHPSGCPGFYPIDGDHIRTYMEASKSEESFHDYIKRFVFEPGDHENYIRHVVTVQEKRR
jgi:glutaconate CoA-transferase subunit A